MATINSLVSMGYSSSSSNGVKSKIKEVQEQLRSLSKDTSISSDERSKLQKEYQEELDALNNELSAEQDATLASIQNNAATLLGSGGNTDGFGSNGSGLDFFFTAGGTMNALKSVNSARVGIENRARTLTSEIKMDRIRGINTSGKEEMLANLTANLTVMDSNLGNNIEKTLSSDSTAKSVDTKPVITRIKDQLAENQKAIEKDVEETYNPKSTEETE